MEDRLLVFLCFFSGSVNFGLSLRLDSKMAANDLCTTGSNSRDNQNGKSQVRSNGFPTHLKDSESWSSHVQIGFFVPSNSDDRIILLGEGRLWRVSFAATDGEGKLNHFKWSRTDISTRERQWGSTGWVFECIPACVVRRYEQASTGPSPLRKNQLIPNGVHNSPPIVMDSSDRLQSSLDFLIQSFLKSDYVLCSIHYTVSAK